MNPVQYIIANEGAGMSPGKLAAQVAHASVEGLLKTYRRDEREPGILIEPNIVRLWRCGGHYAKVVLGVKDSVDLLLVRDYLYERDFKVATIIDEGRTEFDGLTYTAIGVEIVDKYNPHVRATFGEFKLYGSNPSEPEDAIVSSPKPWWRRIYDPTPLTDAQQRAERFF